MDSFLGIAFYWVGAAALILILWTIYTSIPE